MVLENVKPQPSCRHVSCILHFSVNDVFLSYWSLPYKGVLQIEIDSKETKTVCWEGLSKDKADLVCRYLGYKGAYTQARVPFPKDSKASKISYLHCHHPLFYLSQCEFTIADSINCPGLSYIECKYSTIN